MGGSKKKLFQNNTTKISNVFKAIGHPARLQVLLILLEKKHCTCGEIVELLPISQSTVSKHLLELKKVGLIGELFDGRKTIFHLKKDSITNSNDFLTNFIINCKYENAFNAHKNIVIKKVTLDKLFLNSLKAENKLKNRITSPNLKRHNYIFNHLKGKTNR